MKKITAMLAAMALVALFASSCATSQPVGALYTNIRLPLATGEALENPAAPKLGVAVSNSFCGLIATGDSSITTACANGGIKKIHHVDWEATSLFGIYSTYKCIVWGE